MQLSMQGITIIRQFKEQLSHLKSDAGVKKFILPTIDIFYASISQNAQDKIKLNITSLGIDAGSYMQVIEAYQQIQTQYLFECIDSVTNLLQMVIDNKSAIDVYFNKLLDFLEFEQMPTIAPDVSTGILEKMNVPIKYRFLYYLTEKIYALLSQFRGGINLIATHNSDQLYIKKIDKLTNEAMQNVDKVAYVSELFYSELHIREASILAIGELLRNDQVSDIFVVYKTAGYGLSNARQQEHSISYYSLAIKTLTHLSRASTFMQTRGSDQQLSVVIQPMNQETAIGHYGLVRRSVFGVSISYQDTLGVILDVNTSPGFNHVYQVEPHYKLEPDLKILYLAHIKLLTTQLIDAPNHAHKKRRQEKLNALEYIVKADSQGELSPSTFDQAKTGKSYLFVAWNESVTEQLISCAEQDLRTKMWRKFSREKQSIGQLGYSITDENLVAKILEKYASLTQGKACDVNKKIKDILLLDNERATKTSWDLWRFDKSKALEIILIAHYQQLLHPALLSAIEKKYSTLYARSFWMIKESEVQALISSVKENLLSMLWKDSANDAIYSPSPGMLRY